MSDNISVFPEMVRNDQSGRFEENFGRHFLQKVGGRFCPPNWSFLDFVQFQIFSAIFDTFWSFYRSFLTLFGHFIGLFKNFFRWSEKFRSFYRSFWNFFRWLEKVRKFHFQVVFTKTFLATLQHIHKIGFNHGQLLQKLLRFCQPALSSNTSWPTFKGSGTQ